MIVVDANILVYAHRAETPQHDAARAVLAELLESGGGFAIPAPAVTAFLRLVTSHRISDPPPRSVRPSAPSTICSAWSPSGS